MAVIRSWRTTGPLQARLARNPCRGCAVVGGYAARLTGEGMPGEAEDWPTGIGVGNFWLKSTAAPMSQGEVVRLSDLGLYRDQAAARLGPWSKPDRYRNNAERRPV